MLVFVVFFILPFIGEVFSNSPPKCETEIVASEPPCPEGEHYTQDDPQCRKTCANRMVKNNGLCEPFTGCVCDVGLVRLKDDGTGPCIPKNQCPSVITPVEHPGDRIYSAKADAIGYAIASKEYSLSDPVSKSSGHFNSKSSSISSSSSSYSSVISDCGGNKCKDRNAVYKNCPNPCPLTCAEPNPKPCSRMCIKSGCECAPGFLLNEIDGKCVRPQNCPEAKRCPKNAHYVINDETCPKTCGSRLLPGRDTAGACQPFTGCVCKTGFVRKYDNATGPCIRESRCPPIPTECGLNEEPTSCQIFCPPQTCESIYSSYFCLPTECEPGCDCINGYLRNYNGDCVPSDDCFKEEPECGPNEERSDCAIICPPQSCESLYTTYMCMDMNCTAGCNCIDGYLRNSLGVCIPSEQCGTDPSACNGDLNATGVECGSACPATCAVPEPEACVDVCALNGCECNPGYLLSEHGGVCIEPKDCPDGSPICGANQTYVYCKDGCLDYCPTSDSRAQIACSMAYPCPSGCACKPGYLKLSYEDPQCILASECPEVNCTRPNEVWARNPSNCFSERCEDRGQVCDQDSSAPPRCVCEDGFYRNASNVCVPVSECPETSCNDDPNAVFSDCPSACQATCVKPNANEPCNKMCMPSGCVCKPGFIKIEKDGKCIEPKNCPEVGCKGDLNATYSDCTSKCPAKCADLNNKDILLCPAVCGPGGCVCKPGFILNENGQCVQPEDCPAEPSCNGDSNAVFSDCPSSCQATCSKTNGDQACIEMCMPSGCVCKPGFVLSENDGKCIEPEKCPVEVGCNSDLNATYSDCTSRCPAKCADRNNKDVVLCPAVCGPGGCVCKPGFILNENGQCVKPEDCPEEPSCNDDSNAVFSDCPSACQATCTNPDSNQACIKKCMPPGCICKPGFIRIEKDGKCIAPENCPVNVGCNGDLNATTSECPSACPPTCANRNKKRRNVFCPAVCRPDGCVCKPGFILTEINGQCVDPKDCPVEPSCNGDSNAVFSDCPSACQATCANSDTNQLCIQKCMPSGCVCKPGFVRIEKDGKCIEPQNCPAEPQCNGDRNATFKECPSPQATCDEPDVNGPCIEMCMKDGCVCKQGYLLSKTGGQCIKPEDCPGGSPTCRANETYVYCKVGCPDNYCPNDDSLAIVACDPAYPCPGGCACKGGYLRLRGENDTCILASECPPVKCTRPNEVWNPNPPNCLRERCDERDIPCDFPYPRRPSCVCIDGYFRNDDGICVPESECPNKGCNGDVNATFSDCPSSCVATCCEPDTDGTCNTGCAEPNCVCNEGYILSEPGGVCVSPSDCEGGSPTCGPNMTYTGCKIDCPMKRCPVDENEGTVICDPVWPCPSGCVCKPGYLMTNAVDRTCILAADCPPVECTGSNEVWDPNPSSCNFEKCEDIYKTCYDTNPGRPRCVCKEGYYRDENGVCIAAEECQKRTVTQ